MSTLTRTIYSLIFLNLISTIHTVHADQEITIKPKTQSSSNHSIPRQWLPPGLPKSVKFLTISRNIELDMGTGTFLFLADNLNSFSEFGYTNANNTIKPDGKHFEMIKTGATAYSYKNGNASWIVIFNHDKNLFLEIEGKQYVEGYFWVDSKFFEK